MLKIWSLVLMLALYQHLPGCLMVWMVCVLNKGGSWRNTKWPTTFTLGRKEEKVSKRGREGRKESRKLGRKDRRRKEGREEEGSVKSITLVLNGSFIAKQVFPHSSCLALTCPRLCHECHPSGKMSHASWTGMWNTLEQPCNSPHPPCGRRNICHVIHTAMCVCVNSTCAQLMWVQPAGSVELCVEP